MDTTLNTTADTAVNLQHFLSTTRQTIESYLKSLLQQYNIDDSCELFKATTYTVFGGGKRLRPALFVATLKALGVQQTDKLLAPAASIELLHCYSLVHDDLPAMDNDDLRRGVPTCHKAFDEATAILVGDGLQTLAFEILATPELLPVAAATQLKMIKVLGKYSGFQGMILGQAEDLAAEQQPVTIEQLAQLYSHKTGGLFYACTELAALAANCRSAAKLRALQQYSSAVGLAFQIQDDILDFADANERTKSTYPNLIGKTESIQYTHALQQQALMALEIFDQSADLLRELACYIVNRNS